MTLEEQAIEATKEAMRYCGCRTPGELLRLFAEALPDAEDRALCLKDTDDWTPYDLGHWLRILIGQ